MTDPVEIAELLASRLCHELVGPVGGFANGVEFLTELDENASEETIALLSDSAARATAKLRFYRLAYGHAGRGTFDLETVKAVADDFARLSKIACSWDMDSAPEPLPGSVTAKCLLLAVEICASALIGGGRLEGRVNAEGISVASAGPNVRLRDEIVRALLPATPESGPSVVTVHAVYLYGLVTESGARIAVETTEEKIAIDIRPPA